MRPLLFLGLVTQLACWSEQTFTRDCIAAGHCLVSDSGVGGGGDIGGGGGGDIGGGGGGGTTGGGTGGGFVDDGGVITWAEVVSELFDAIPRGLDAGFTVAFTPTLSTGKWVGGVLTSDGRVVCIPAAGSNALRVSANGVVTVQDLGFSGGWEGGVLLSDGGVLGLPSVSATFLAAGPVSATEIAVGLPLSGASYPYFEGGVITLEGQVLLAPKNAIYPGVFDTFTNTLTVLDGGSAPGTAIYNSTYSGAVLLADGQSAILVPRNAQRMMLVTPTGAQLIGPGGLQGHGGGLLLPSSEVLMMPYDTGRFVIWDGGAARQVGPQGTRSYFGGAWSTNGYAYAIQTDGPSAGPTVAVIDRDGLVTEVLLPSGTGLYSNSHYGLTAMEDGTLVGCPYDSTQVLFITPVSKRPVSRRVMMSPWLNKW